MANGPNLGTATLRTALDGSGLNRGLTTVGSNIQRFSATASARLRTVGTALTAGITVPLTAATTAAVLAVRRLGDTADALLDLSQQSGLTTRQLQEFGAVARAAGVDSDTLGNAAIQLSRRLREGGNEALEFTDAARALGVSIRDDLTGQLRPMSDLVPELITRLQGIEDVTRRNVIANQVFGRGATELLPVLGLTADEYERLTLAARESGEVMSDEALQAANQARIAFAELSNDLSVLGRDLTLAVTPAVTGLVNIVRSDFVPLLRSAAETVASLVQRFNELAPETRRGIFTAGLAAATLGPIALALSQIVRVIPAVVAGFAALRTAALTMMGPAGWAILGVTAIVGVANALAGRGATGLSLEQAIQRADTAAASVTGFGTLDTAVMHFASNLTGPVKQAFQSVIGDIQDLVGAAENAQEAMFAISLGTGLATQLTTDSPATRALRNAFLQFIRVDGGPQPFEEILNALMSGDFGTAAGLARHRMSQFPSQRNLALAEEPEVRALRAFIAEIEGAERAVASFGQRVERPTTTPTPAPGVAGASGVAGAAPQTVAAETAEELVLSNIIAIRDEPLRPASGDRFAQLRILRAAEEAAEAEMLAAIRRFGAPERTFEGLRGFTGLPTSVTPEVGVVTPTRDQIAAINAQRLETIKAEAAARDAAEGIQRFGASIADLNSIVSVGVRPVLDLADAIAIPRPAVSVEAPTREQIVERNALRLASIKADAALAEATRGINRFGDDLLDLGRIINVVPSVSATVAGAVSIPVPGVSAEVLPTPQGRAREILGVDEAAAAFRDRVILAGAAFARDLAAAIKGGDVAGAIQGLFGAGGQIASALSSFGGAAFGLSKGAAGWLGLIGGLLPIIGSIIGLFIPGARRSREEAARAPGAAARGAPAIEFNVNVQQSLSVQSLTDPASRAAVDGLLNETVRRITHVIEGNLMPRIQRLEAMA
jgi:hypothetical protein